MDQSREVKPDPRRAIPAVDRLLSELRGSYPDLPGWAALEAVRRTLASERQRLSAAEGTGRGADPKGDLIGRAAACATALCARHPRRVVNATGTLLHTNLGRAPLAPGAAAAAAGAAAADPDREMGLGPGGRGR